MSLSAKSVLMLLNRVPYPVNDGGALSMMSIIKEYAESGCKVHVLAMNTTKHHANEAEFTTFLLKWATVDFVLVDNRIRFYELIRNIFLNKSYVLERFVSATYKEKLIELLTGKPYDLIHLDHLTSLLYVDVIREHCKSLLVYRAQNVESQVWKSNALVTENVFKKLYFLLQAARLQNFELLSLSKVDLILAITDEDARYFRSVTKKPVITHTVKIDIPALCPTLKPELSFFFLGSFEWLPNEEGIRWFLNTVWPVVTMRFPNIKFFIAGKKMPDWLMALRSTNIIPVGEVDNAVNFINEHSILIAPLVSGSGVRVKILEAMAQGRGVIATSVAAQGISVNNEDGILIADSVEQFVRQIERCSDPEFVSKLGYAAYQYMLQNNVNSVNDIFKRSG